MSDEELDPLYLKHVEKCIRRVQSYVAGDSEIIGTNPMVLDAVPRNLQVMAESTQRLSTAIKSTEPQIPWNQIGGFRHRLVHDYFNIDTVLIKRVVDEYVQDLLDAVLRMKTRL